MSATELRMSIHRKINLTFAAGFCLLLGLAINGLVVTWSARTRLGSLINGHGGGYVAALDTGRLATAALSEERAMLGRLQGDRAAEAVRLEKHRQLYAGARSDMDARLALLAGAPAAGEEEKAVLRGVRPLLAAWDAAHGRYWTAISAGDSREAVRLAAAEVNPAAARVSAQLAELVRAERGQMLRAVQGLATGLRVSGWISLVLAVLAVAVVVAGVWIVRKGIRQLGGELDDLRKMADEVTHASCSLSATSQALSDGATRQAASTEQTAASSSQVKLMAQRNRENAREAARFVSSAEEKFGRANRSLVKLEETMEGIGVSASKIARIIKVIDDIAFQTNILSLNAAVEAARAGDAGMGFAVVADEVRGLAQRCAKAAQETADLINESITRAAEGKGAASEVAGTIRAVTSETDSIRLLVGEVNQGSEDQAGAMDEIATAISQIERVTQDSAANAEEAAAASEELTVRATELRMILSRITDLAGVGAGNAALGTDAPPATMLKRPASASLASLAAADNDDRDFRPF